MFQRLVFAGAVLFMVGTDRCRAVEEKKTDGQTIVAAGTEVTLTPVEVVPADKPDESGRFTVTVKAGKAKKVKMPEQRFALGFHPETIKGGGVKVESVPDGTGMRTMRTVSGKGDEEGPWQADPGDVITHVNGYAVNSVEDVIVAVSLAKDKKDVQIVLKDVTEGTLMVFYVTATKQ